MQRYVQDTFANGYKATIGVDFVKYLFFQFNLQLLNSVLLDDEKSRNAWQKYSKFAIMGYCGQRKVRNVKI